MEIKYLMEDKLKIQSNQEYFERKLNSDNIEKIIRYMTQCIDRTQFDGAIINLATETHRGKPLSNSILLHELKEAEEFEAMGYDFSSKKLETMSYNERLEVRNKRNKKYREIREPHLKALVEQYDYLAEVARNRGYNVSPGTILKLSPFSPKVEVEEASAFTEELKYKPLEFNEAMRFVLSLLDEEKDYKDIFSELHHTKAIKSGIYLYEIIRD